MTKGQIGAVLLILIGLIALPLIIGFISGVFRNPGDVTVPIVIISISVFLTIIGVLIAKYNYRIGSIVSHIGIGVLILGMLILEMAYVSNINKAPQLSVKECSSFTDNDFASAISCIISGYKYGGSYANWNFFGFWVTGIVAPLLLFMFLFYDFVESSGVMRNRTAIQVVGVSLGIIAYRGFAVSNLIQILSLGTVGIGLLALNLIFAGGLLAYINKILLALKPIEASMEIVTQTGRAKAVILGSFRNYNRMSLDAIKSIFESIKPQLNFLLQDNEVQAFEGQIANTQDIATARKVINTLLQRIQQSV